MPDSNTRRAPGPNGLPFFGSMFPALRDPLALMLESRATYGDIVRFKFGPFDYYLVSDPDVIKHVMLDNAKAYRKSRNYLGLKIVLGEGLLTSEGEHWRRQRRLSQPAFHRERLSAFVSQMTHATRDMLDRWASEGSNERFDIHGEMMRLTFRMVGLTLFSADVAGDAREVGEAMEVALHWANDYAESLVRIPPSVPTPRNLRFKRAMKTLDALVYRIIRDRRAAEEARAGAPQPKLDLLGMLMDATDEDTGRRMTDEQLRDEVITMVLAGHETTANLLSWTFQLLSKHPEIERRLRDEVTAVIGDREPTLADLPKLELGRAILDESLRLFPPAWMFEREATVADHLGPYPIAPKTIVGICTYVLHRHPAHWENPEGFDPDRFRADRGAGRARYAYLPFGAGPRTCIGNHFAMMEALLVLAMVVREHRIELDPSHKVELEPVITLRPKTGIVVRRRPIARARAQGKPETLTGESSGGPLLPSPS